MVGTQFLTQFRNGELYPFFISDKVRPKGLAFLGG